MASDMPQPQPSKEVLQIARRRVPAAQMTLFPVTEVEVDGIGMGAGLIQSLSQSPWPKVSACGVLEGIASISCLNPLLPQLILI
jgi:hypothetical protein